MNKLIQIALIGVALSQLQGCAASPGWRRHETAVALDRRTAGIFIGDQEIELRAMNRLYEAYPAKNRQHLHHQL